jgi:hypothetical protein
MKRKTHTAILLIFTMYLSSCSKDCDTKAAACSENPPTNEVCQAASAVGFITQKIKNAKKLDIAVAHKMDLKPKKNVKNANANKSLNSPFHILH